MGGIEAVDPRYVVLLARAHEVLAADPRVVRVEVGGSIGAGEADEWSDLDLAIYTAPDGFDAFVADWQNWLAEITPTVLARTPIAPWIINTVTQAGLTLDIAVYRDGTPPWSGAPAGYRAGLIHSAPFRDHASAVDYAVNEMFRGLAGPFIGYLSRGYHVPHMAGCGHVLGLLTAVMLAETDSPPVLAKNLTSALTNEQRAAIAALPPLSATRDALAAFELAVAAEVIRRGRPLFVKYGLDWPDALEAVARARVASIGLELPDV